MEEDESSEESEEAELEDKESEIIPFLFQIIYKFICRSLQNMMQQPTSARSNQRMRNRGIGGGGIRGGVGIGGQ